MCGGSKLKKSISHLSLACLSVAGILAIAGCFGMNNYKTFSYAVRKDPKPITPKEPVQKATVELSSDDTPDPNPKFVQAKVNDTLERLLKAVEKSKKNHPAQFTPAGETSDDPDSLAAKLTSPSEQQNAYSPQPQKIKSQPATPAIKKEQPPLKVKAPKPKIKIIKIDPIAVQPERSPTPKPISISPPSEPEVIVAQKHQANKSAKLNILDMESDPDGALQALLKRLEQKMKDRPEDTATQVKFRLIHTLLGQYKQSLKGDNKNTGNLAVNLADLVKIFESRDLDPSQQANRALEVVNRLQESLKKTADLKIANVQLCREVLSFGSYTIMPKNYFIAGKRRPVIVYIELENFISKYLTDKKLYQTLLSLTIEVLDTNNSNRVCWRHHDEQIEDLSAKQRRDFYIARLITLPATLPSGDLKLKITVEDIHGNKVAQKIIPLKIN